MNHRDLGEMRTILVVVLGLIVAGCTKPIGQYGARCVTFPFDRCAKLEKEAKAREAQQRAREEKAEANKVRQRQLAEEQSARLQAKRAAADKKHQETVAANVADVKAKGYDLMTFRDFQVDANNLAKRHAKIAVTGRYLSLSEGGYLIDSLISIAIMRRTGQLNQGIYLLTDNAARGLRAYFLECTSHAVGSQLGCPISIYGMATTCTMTIFSSKRTRPCIEVKGGWYVPRPR